MDVRPKRCEPSRPTANAATPAWTFASLAVLFDRTGEPEIAATLYGATTGYPIADLILGLNPAVEHLRDVLTPGAFDGCVSEGAAMELAEAVRYARHHIGRARLQLSRLARRER